MTAAPVVTTAPPSPVGGTAPLLWRLEAVRGAAAAYVACGHLFRDELARISPALGVLLAFGQEAVIVFFLLSGYVIHWSVAHKPGLGFGAYLRGTKHTVFEGGLRVPFLAWWPGRVPAGAVCREFVTGLDVLPTFARAAGGQAPAGRVIDGKDFSPLLLGVPGARSPRESFYSLYGYNTNRLESIRAGPWKLHLTPPAQLFNLDADLGEVSDVAAQQPDIVARLRRLAGDIRADLGKNSRPAAVVE